MKTEPNQACLIYIDSHDGVLYFASVIDLFARQVIGWTMQTLMRADIVLSALFASALRRKPEQTVIGTLIRGANLQDMIGDVLLRSIIYHRV